MIVSDRAEIPVMDPPQRPIRITVSYSMGLRTAEEAGFLIYRNTNRSQKPGNSCPGFSYVAIQTGARNPVIPARVCHK